MNENSVENHSNVIDKLCNKACETSLNSKWYRTFLLAFFGGAFITFGALFSVLIASEIDSPGVKRLVEGFAFSSGFFMVIVSGAVLFTEANVLAPISMLHCKVNTLVSGIVRFWVIAFVGNLIGALVISSIIGFAQIYPQDVDKIIDEITSFKLSFYNLGGIGSWFKIVLSGILANWLVGMAAFLSELGTSIIDKYIPILLAVSIFVAANFQHSPANMAYFSLLKSLNEGPDWSVILFWNILPAAIGNMIGGLMLVALPMWYLYGKKLVNQ